MHVGIRLGGQIALVHTLRAVTARRAAVLVDTLRLALPAAHTGAAGPEGCLSNGAGRHRDSDEQMLDVVSLRADLMEFSSLKRARGKKNSVVVMVRWTARLVGVPARRRGCRPCVFALRKARGFCPG